MKNKTVKNDSDQVKAQIVKHLTSAELAERLRLNEQTARMWRMNGQGPRFIKAGKNVLYRIQDVEKWENENLVGSTAEAR